LYVHIFARKIQRGKRHQKETSSGQDTPDVTGKNTLSHIDTKLFMQKKACENFRRLFAERYLFTPLFAV
jgi:hypothetical protein